MLIYALIAFGAGAIGGLVLASSVLRGRIAPWGLSLLHAALGATGLGLLLAILAKGAENPAICARRRLRETLGPDIRAARDDTARFAGVDCARLTERTVAALCGDRP